MRRGPVLVGVVLGLLLAVGVIALHYGNRTASPALPIGGPVLSDCDGALREVVIQYVASAGDIVSPACSQFLRQLPADITVRVVCPSAEDFADFQARVGDVAPRLVPIFTKHSITTWSRDRWITLSPRQAGKPTVLVSPRGEAGTEAWPARKGDQRVGDDLAGAIGADVSSLRSELYFDGGDFACDGETVFVSPNVLRRNLQRTVKTREELTTKLAELLKKRIVLLDGGPDHHAGMYLMPLGGRRVLVADPRWGRELVGVGSGAPASAILVGGATWRADFRNETLAKFDAVAERCRAAGCEVIRVPVVPAQDGRTYLTYVNAILDERDGRDVVYMPVFRGADALNAAATKVWRDAGFDVRAVDCTETYVHFGSLRCLVSVLRRG